MYVSLSPARSNRLGRLRGARGGRRLGDFSDIDWGSILTTGINDASAVAKVALQPVPSVHTILPGGGSQVIDYGVGTPANALGTSSLLTGASFLSSPTFLLLGVGLIAVLLIRK